MTAETSDCANHIVLIGMRGSGKSTIGRLLAAALKREHIDTDDLVVEHAGQTISAIFFSEGEAGFRKRECDAVAEAVRRAPAVISVGGGAVLDDTNVRRLRGSGVLVWLSAPPDVLYGRVHADEDSSHSRPSLTSLTGPAECESVMQSRDPIYRSAADIEVDTSRRSPANVVRLVLQSIAGNLK